MSTPKYVIYCDKADDEELARVVFRAGPLSNALIQRLPSRSVAPASLARFLQWERSDWLITRDDELVAAAELSRHGYTGDNGFQRFARLQRAASLGIPGVYFTPFSRTRLNELDEGRNSPRNVAPEMFAALLQAGEEYDVPCLALRWPTDTEGTPIPLGERGAAEAVDQLRGAVESFATTRKQRTLATTYGVPEELMTAMRVQAQLPVRGGATRPVIDTPINVEQRGWLEDLLPRNYFSTGKADKILGHLALMSRRQRSVPVSFAGNRFWNQRAQAQVLYLGYQWRPDPSCGLIAFSGVLARRSGRPLIVVWPRVFLRDGRTRRDLLAALSEFALHGTGPVATRGRQLGFSPTSLDAFSTRLNTDPNQFGLLTRDSKVGRILAENADLCVFGDGLYLPR